MGIECKCQAEYWGKIVKVFNILSGLFLIALGILRFIFNVDLAGDSKFLQFVLSAYYMYDV